MDSALKLRNYIDELDETLIEKRVMVSKPEHPQCSVVIATLGNRKFLVRCLRALAEQTRKDFETLVVDNNPGEGVQNEVSGFGVSYIKLKKPGLSVARNIGIRASRAPIVAFLDDDAIPADDWVERHLNAHETYDALGLRGRCFPIKDSLLNKVASHYDLGEKAMPHPINLEGNSSFKRSFLLSVGGFNPDFWNGFGHEGLELTYRAVVLYGTPKEKLIYAPEPLIHHDYADSFGKYFGKMLRHAKIKKSLGREGGAVFAFARSYPSVDSYPRGSWTVRAVRRLHHNLSEAVYALQTAPPGLRISGSRPASPREWDEVWSRCDHATYFHSREWAEIWAAVRPRYALDPKIVLFSDGKKALLPLLSEKIFKGLSKTHHSSCCGTYGGPIAEDALTDEHRELLRDFMIRRLGSLRWRMNPFDASARPADEASVLTDATSVLRLGRGFDPIQEGFTRQNRSNIRKALASGISVAPAKDLEDWKAYFSAYQDSLNRWAEETTSNYPWEVFETMFGRRSENITLWLARHENKVIAGILCFYSKKIVAAWHGAALKDYFEHRPVNLLWNEIIRDACARGYSWLDFGPSGGHEGVLKFKKTFGTQEISCPMVETGRPAPPKPAANGFSAAADFKNATFRGLSWSLTASIVKQVLSFVVGVILARLLSPDEFGLLGMVMVFSGFVNLFVGQGLGAAIIQKKDIDGRHLDSIFWLNVSAGAACTGLLVLAAPGIAVFYGQPILQPLTALLATTFFIGAFSVVHQALLSRHIDFRKLALVDIVSAMGGGLLGVVLALKGHGVWSLAWQTVATVAISALLTWFVSSWRPGFRMDPSAIREIMGYTLHFIGSSVLGYFTRSFDNLLIGRYLSPSALGVYSKSYQLMLLPLNQVSWVVSRVMFPALSAIQNDMDKVRRVYLRATRTIALITFPLMVGLIVVSRPFVLCVFGEKWSGMIPLLRILCWQGMIQSISSSFGWIYNSQGRPDLQFKWGIVSASVIMTSFIVGLKWGVEGVAICYLLSGVVLFYPDWAIAGSVIKLRLPEMLKNLMGAFIASVVMGVLVWLLGTALPAGWPAWKTLVLQVSLGCIFYWSLIHAFKVRAYTELREIVEMRKK